MKTRITSTLLSALVLTLAAGSAASAEEALRSESWCGTTPLHEEIFAARRLFLERRAESVGGGVVAARSGPAEARASLAGDIATLDGDAAFLGGNPFDLDERGLRFQRRSWGYRVTRTKQAFRDNFGQRLALDDDDSAAIRFPAGFRFPFFDRAYDSVFVNSDGNVTFGQEDRSFLPRDLHRFLAGPPRIAALLADLDPSSAPSDGGVYYLASGDRVQITWRRLPRPGSFGLSSVQLTLSRSGQVDIAFLEVEPRSGIVGISPGNDAGLELVDTSRDLPYSHRAKRAAIGEEFTPSLLDDTGVGRAFYQSFQDNLDFLTVWFDFPQDLGGAFAYQRLMQNHIRGIGESQGVFASVGGPSLESFIVMGSLANYPDELDVPFLRTNSVMTILGHEIGHRWMARVRFIDANGDRNRRLLGRQLAHWSFLFDSDGSVDEGNEIMDLGGGRFSTVDATYHYGNLDLYLMGLIPPSAVSNLFYVESTEGRDGPRPAAAPAIGVEFSGRRVDLTIDDIIAAEGVRSPNSTTSPKTFNVGFVLVGPLGKPPSQASIDKLDRIRERWIEFFSEATGGRAEMTTTVLLK